MTAGDTPSSGQPRVRRNDWSTLPKPDPGEPPRLAVSVVMPAYRAERTLDLALAALAAQRYPAHLLEVVVVDDGSEPELRLPEIRPERTRLLRAPADGWGRAHACHYGAMAADGEVVHWLDADMIAFADEVEAQARWHEQCSYVVTTGYKRFVEPRELSPDDVYAAVGDGSVERLFQEWTPHAWVEEVISSTDLLRDGDHECFRVAVGATGALRRELYREVGGMDTSLHLGEDSEMGYRLAQAGAVFVPVPEAISWHLGASTAMRTTEAVKRYNIPFVTDRMPLPRYRRQVPHRTWTVPLVEVVVPAAEESYERARACVEAVLASTLSDLVVTLVGPWAAVTEEHRPPLADPRLDLRLTREHFRGEPRVRLASDVGESPFPAAFRLRLDGSVAVRPGTLAHLVERADAERLGLLVLTLDGREVGRLVRTAALRRAHRVSAPGEDIDALIAELWGTGQADLSGLALDQAVASPTAIKALRAAAADADTWRAEAARLQEEALRWKREAVRRGFGRPLWRWLPGYLVRRRRSKP